MELPLWLLICYCLLTIGCSADDYCETKWNARQKVAIERRITLQISQVRSVGIYFCESRPIFIQIWRHHGNMTYVLVWEQLVQPPQQIPRRTVYPMPRTLSVQRDYLIGLFSPDDTPLPIGLKFVGNGGNVIVSDLADRQFEINRPYKFIDLPYPYIMLVRMCDNQDCPLSVEPGDTGKQVPGQAGDLGHRVQCESQELFQNQGKAVIQNSLVLPQIRAKVIITNFCKLRRVTAQVWESFGQGRFRLLWQKILSPPRTTGTNTVIRLAQSEFVDLRPHYKLGLYVERGEEEIPISKVYREDALFILTNSSGPFRINQDYFTGGLEWPYEFTLKFCASANCSDPVPISDGLSTPSAFQPGVSPTNIPNFVGNRGPPGDDGNIGPVGPPGGKGDKGDDGHKGDKGKKGDKGNKGPTGEPGLPGSTYGNKIFGASSDKKCACGHGLLQSNVIVGVLVWAVILGVVIVVMMILIIIDLRENHVKS